MPASEPRPRATARASERAGGILHIDLDAIIGNWRRLAAELKPGARCAAVVKADAYGLGMAEVAPALSRAGCHLFFVATIDEGLALRRLLPHAEIAVFNGFFPGAAGDFARARLMPVLNDLGQVDAWRRYAARRGGLPAMLHLDTGMSRLGLPRAELDALEAKPERLAGFALAGVLSHLACADAPEDAANEAQRAAFRAALDRLPRAPASLAASSGIFLGARYHFDVARPGAALYGVNPRPGHLNPMTQVVHLQGRIIQVRDVDRGESVGYGAAHRMDRPGRVATIAAGYADGWLRSASHRGSVGIGGHRAPVIGRISMDLMTVDVTGIDASRIAPGTLVDLIDAQHGVDQVAEAAQTIGYEILTSLGRRYARFYRGGAA